jgi:hypothetical protein
MQRLLFSAFLSIASISSVWYIITLHLQDQTSGAGWYYLFALLIFGIPTILTEVQLRRQMNNQKSGGLPISTADKIVYILVLCTALLWLVPLALFLAHEQIILWFMTY